VPSTFCFIFLAKSFWPWATLLLYFITKFPVTLYIPASEQDCSALEEVVWGKWEKRIVLSEM